MSVFFMQSAQIVNLALDAWMMAGEALLLGAKKYKAKKQQVGRHRKNYAAILQAIANGHGLTVAQLTRSRTLVRELDIFSRDLELLDVEVWYRSRPAVYTELAPLVFFHGALLPGPYCSATTRRRLYKEDALHAHIMWDHPHHVAEPVVVPLNTHRCTLCPPSATSVYDPQTLLHHIDNVYVLRQSLEQAPMRIPRGR
ncbi:hypothetical protein K438DRAFT_1961362 [Mycena galopus ATCC 62051]|nr:hypothetical protein K438DRAFT_1961362 [Mycena galopus ATCC 62051]